MKRTFKNKMLTIGGVKYEPILPHYDLSIIEGEEVEVRMTISGKQRACFVPSERQKEILGIRAHYVFLKVAKGEE